VHKAKQQANKLKGYLRLQLFSKEQGAQATRIKTTSTTKTHLPHDVYGCSTQHTSCRQERPASIIVVNAGSDGIGMVCLQTQPCSISLTHVMLFIILLHNLLSSIASSLLGSIQELMPKSPVLFGNRNCCLIMWCPFDSTCILGVL
jgi:hypothetical protein